MRCRHCNQGLLLSRSPSNQGGDLLTFSCGHQVRIFPEHNSRGRCAYCGAFLSTFRAEWMRGSLAAVCNRPGCLEIDAWLSAPDQDARAILEATASLVDSMAQERPQAPPAYLDPILGAPGPSVALPAPVCEASTIKGHPCRNRAQEGSLFCGVHREAWEAVE